MSPWQQQFEHNIQTLGFSHDTTQALMLESPEPQLRPDFKCRNPEQFNRHLNNFINTLPGLKAIYNTPSSPDLKTCCELSFQHPRLLQQLHLLERLNTHNYYNALFSALAGFAIAKDIELSRESSELTFLAGLYHDIGFLYYPMEPPIQHLNESQAHDPAVRAHGAVGAGIVKRLSKAPLALCDIIRNHHQRNDGTGYPSAAPTENDDVIAIISITDLIVRATHEYSHYPEHNHQLTRCTLQLHTNEYPQAIYRAAINLTRHKQDVTEPPKNQPKASIVTEQGYAIACCNKDLDRALNLLIQNQPVERNVALRKLQEQLHTGIHNIGIDLQGYSSSVEAFESNHTLELINLNVLQNEMCYLMGRLYTALQERTSQLNSHEISLKTQLHDILERTPLPRLVTPETESEKN